MAEELKHRETFLLPYQRKQSDESYEQKMNSEISNLYVSYIKFSYNFRHKTNILTSKMGEVSIKLKGMEIK